jgi:hypothetical protein
LPDEIDTNPGAKPKGGRGRTSEPAGRGGALADTDVRAPGPEDLLATIYSDESEPGLIPPPLPEDDDDDLDAERADDRDDSGAASGVVGDDDEPTHHRPNIALSGSLSSQEASSSSMEAPAAGSESGEPSSPFDLPRTAADDLGLSRAAVSESVAALEKHLGARLLTRTTRRVQPTAEGVEYLARCERILGEVDAAGEAVRGARAMPQGRLRVYVSYGAGPDVFAHDIRELLRTAG